jgi:hypothetical protein
VGSVSTLLLSGTVCFRVEEGKRTMMQHILDLESVIKTLMEVMMTPYYVVG